MARLFLAREINPYSPFGNQDDIRKIAEDLPAPGSIHTSYYGQTFNVEQIKFPVMPHLYVGDDQHGLLRNGLHFKRMTAAEQQKLRDAVILANTYTTVVEFALHTVDDGLVMTRSHNDMVSAFTILFDEAEDKALRLEQAHIEPALATVLPHWSRIVFRIAEKRLIHIHEITQLDRRTWLAPVINGTRPGGTGFHPVKNRLAFGAIRDVIEGKALHSDLTHQTYHLPYRSHLAPITTLLHPNLCKVRDRMLSDITETRVARATSPGRRISLGQHATFDRAHVTSPMRPVPLDDHFDYGGGALAFGFTPGYGQLAKPTWGERLPCMSHIPVQGFEMLQKGGKPFMVVTSTPYCWLAYAFVPAATKLLPTDVTENFTSQTRIHNLVEFQVPAGSMAYHVVIPMSIDHADMEDVATRHSTVKGLDPDTTAAIREVPYMGAFLQDCLITLKGQIKRFYPDLNNVTAFGDNHFPCIFAHSTYTWGEQSSYDDRSFHPSPYQGTPRALIINKMNYQMLATTDYTFWSKLHSLVGKDRTTIPQYFFPEMSINAHNGIKTDDLQPVSPKTARVLDL